MSKLKWSKYQLDIFKDIAHGKGHTIVQALAGSGKTSVLLESFKHIPRKKKALMVAFNKSIATELRDRAGFKKYLDISTLHSFGFKAIREVYPDVVLDTKKTINIVSAIIGSSPDMWDLNCSICKTISLCKNSLIDSPLKVEELMDDFSIETFDLEKETFVKFVLKAMQECKEQKATIDFDDMVWYPYVLKLKLKTYDYVFCDEAQDLNKCQMVMVLGSCKKGGRIIAVMDKNQAIYGFRAADEKAAKFFIKFLNAKEFSMPITYRCPKKIVYLAQQIVPSLQHASNAIDGSISNILETDILNEVSPGDFIISRTNAPLIKHCMSLLKHNIPANIKGRDVGSNLIWFVKKSKKKTINSLIQYVDNWREREVGRVTLLKRDPTSYQDKAECLINLCEGCSSIDELISTIKSLFDDVDDKDKVTLSTTHKIKGLEADNCFLLMNTFRYSPGVTGEEANILYVAQTRAKKKLFLVRKKTKYTEYDHKSKALTTSLDKLSDKTAVSEYEEEDYYIG